MDVLRPPASLHRNRLPGLLTKQSLLHRKRIRLNAAKLSIRLPICTSQVFSDVESHGNECRPTLEHELMQAVVKPGSSVTCSVCGRRHLLGAMGGILSLEASLMAHASVNRLDSKIVAESVHPRRSEWYEELFAAQMDVGMKSYETELAGYKRELFDKLDKQARVVLELGVGTGPNIKYYANNRSVINIVGIDPNLHMERYARAAVAGAGLASSQFTFIQGVGEALPVDTESMDAVICTLVLCSVRDVAATLKEAQRVLKPGGSFFFIEHVAAPEGSSARLWQNVLDPIQQFVADGCHLTRDSLESIRQAKFTVLHAKCINIPNLPLINSHIIGIAQL